MSHALPVMARKGRREQIRVAGSISSLRWKVVQSAESGSSLYGGECQARPCMKGWLVVSAAG